MPVTEGGGRKGAKERLTDPLKPYRGHAQTHASI